MDGNGLRRTTGFLLLVVADVVALVTLLTWYLVSYQPRGGSVGGVMGQMMGGGGANGMTAMPGGVWAALVVLIVVAMAGVVGLGYFLAYPEIRLGPGPAPPVAAQPHATPEGGPQMSWEVLMRTAKPEEQKVLEVLAAHDGSYLQKFVVKEAGLSKLKTHRIVSRLAERGVVTVERSGNTNQVTLAPWVKGSAAKPTAGQRKANVS